MLHSWRSISLRVVVSVTCIAVVVSVIAMQTSTESASPNAAESHCSSVESSSADELSIHSALEIALGTNDSPSSPTASSSEPDAKPPVCATSPVNDEPPFSYLALIAMAIDDAPDKRLTLSGICDYFTRSFGYYRSLESDFLRKSILYHLSVHPCFRTRRGEEDAEEIDDYDRWYWVLNFDHKVILEKVTYRPQVQNAVYSPAMWSSRYDPYPSTLHVCSAPPPHNSNRNNNTRKSLSPRNQCTQPHTKRGPYCEASSADPNPLFDLVPCYFTELGDNTVGWSNGPI